jgi:hypothetical protein
MKIKIHMNDESVQVIKITNLMELKLNYSNNKISISTNEVEKIIPKHDIMMITITELKNN